MTDVLLVLIIVALGIISFQINQLKESSMSAYTDLADSMAALATAIDGYIAFTDKMFDALQVALANQTPADALAAVQAAVATAQAEKAKIDADIAKDAPPAPPTGGQG